MASAKQRQPQQRRTKSSYGEAPEIAAIGKLLGNPGPQAILNKLVAEQEAAYHATLPPLSDAVVRQRAKWTNEGKATSTRFIEETAKWERGWTTLPDFHFPARELLHVYGADRTGSGGEDFYALEWGHIDPFAGTGSFSRADRRTGELIASHYTTSGWLHAYAGIGVRITPKTGIGMLSVRPYVNWSGNDLLQHRVFDPQLGEQRWAVGAGWIGIIVQSQLLSGGSFQTDWVDWQPAWSRSELNPQSASDHDGTMSSSTGLVAEDLTVTSARRYTVWVVCQVGVFADPGFAVATRASASIHCNVPFIVIQETPA
jgi:hypothetical protein